MNRTHILVAAGIVLALLAIVMLVDRTPTNVERQPPRAAPAGQRQQPQPLRQTDEKGATWVLALAGGQSLAAQAGPPIVVKTDVRRVNKYERSIGLILQGRAGEVYRPGVTINGDRVPAPAFRIVDEAGQVLVRGNFNYG